FSSRRRHTRFSRDWSSDVCSSDLASAAAALIVIAILIWLVSKGGKEVVQSPAVGTAQVAAAQAALRQAPSDSADLVVTLKKGDRSEERRVGKECRSRVSAGR